MKKRLRKKLLKKTHAAGQIAASSPSALEDDAKLFAVECWRIKKLLPEFKDSKKYLVLASSVERLFEALVACGIEIDDPEGAGFRDGMTLDVALFEKTPQLADGVRVISETLAPTVYVKNKLVQPAKVIVSVGTGGT